MLKNIKKDQILFVFRLILGGIFIYSAFPKLKDPQVFLESVQNYQVFGLVISSWIAVWVPALEALLGLLLISGVWRRETLVITAFLYITFDVMILQAMLRGLDISCGCFNPAEAGPIDIYKILENLVLTSISFGALYLDLIYRPNSTLNTETD